MLFGSFVLAVLHFFRLIVDYLRDSRDQNGWTACLFMIVTCLIECCKAIWDMLSANGYYLVALYGLDFCSSLRLGMELTNLGVTSLFYVMGSLLVNVAVTLVMVFSTLISVTVLNLTMTIGTACGTAILVSGFIGFALLNVYSVGETQIMINHSNYIVFLSGDHSCPLRVRLCGHSHVSREAVCHCSWSGGLYREDADLCYNQR